MPLRLANDEYRAAIARRLVRPRQEQMSVMSKHHLGFLPSRGAEADAVLEKNRGLDVGANVTRASMDGPGLAAVDHAQLERDIAAIERATAALRRGDPALETW